MGLKRTARLDPGGNRIALLLLRIIQQYFVFFSLKNGRRVVEGLRRKRERERGREKEEKKKISNCYLVPLGLLCGGSC